MTDRRTYVLDTSVLLSDPWAIMRFAEHEVVVPLVVISELEAKRHHHELGWFARQALRLFDDLRLEHGRLDQPIPVGDDGGTLHVELNHSDPSVLPAGFRNETNDSRILTCAANLAAEGKRVTLVSKDIPLRVKAGAVGLAADEYHAQDVVTSGWTGMAELDVASEDIDGLFADGDVDLEAARDLPCHTGVRLLGTNSHALGRVNADKRVQVVRGDREAFGLRGRSAEQRVALDLLLSGRTFLADEALRLGLVKEVVVPEELLPRVLAYADDVARNCAPSALAVIKRQVYDDALRDMVATSAQAEKLMHESMQRPDFIEGITDFFEKRPPDFPPLKEDMP